MREFELIVLTPPGLDDPSIALAASRGGAWGVLDWEYLRDTQVAVDSLAKLRDSTDRHLGIKLNGNYPEFAQHLTSRLPENVRIVILTPGEAKPLRPIVRALREFGVRVLWESTSQTEADVGVVIGVDCLIAKGNESAGRVGDETTFILLQRLLASCSVPVWAQGGIGRYSAAAACIAGAAGAILDAQLWLTAECEIPKETKSVLGRMDGSETVCIGAEVGECYRVYSRPGVGALAELKGVAKSLADQNQPMKKKLRTWRQAIQQRIGWNLLGQVCPVGQDAAFASGLTERFQTVQGVLDSIRQAVAVHLALARKLKPLDEGSPLACSHGTRYPIVQGPMTRVSDTPEFALSVANAGGLPFLALALMKAPEVSSLLQRTREKLRDKPWGVGILGFVPLELRQEQLEVIRRYCPPYVLIAGGRPDQARFLEADGIPTYLHVPSPGLLRMFIESGSRRFVFEGRECGGHVGPRSSFVLWESMIDVLLDLLPADEMSKCHVLFAAGIHDGRSASMVAAMAAPLAERGARIGTLLGTAYLFTEEAVQTGTIAPAFQQLALRCNRTVLLESGLGHAIRCIPTSYVAFFEEEKQRLRASGRSPDEVRTALEECNVGRLRIASKGITRPAHGESKTREFVKLSVKKQLHDGMYMIGQLAAMRDRTCTIAELHKDVSVNGTARLLEIAEIAGPGNMKVRSRSAPCDVAIIGMGCLLPKAGDLSTYWENILAKVDAITEIPHERWDWRQYYDSDPKTPDKIYSKWGGFLDSVPFDPLRYGMPPNILRSIEPLQLLTLEVARSALADAGYAERSFPRERASVILGAGGGVADLGHQYAFRSALPMFMPEGSIASIMNLPEWTEDSFPGILLNVAAGRVANRFDLGGVNYTVDAACASSLAAVYLAVRELETGSSDLVIAGGADTVQNPFAYLCFSKTHALSPTGRCRAFDERADGIAISEGLAMLVLKRLQDAERDGDRIYAVIKGIAGSSDGRERGLTAPHPEGQVRALNRAYAKAGFSPASVDLIEAHGTGTVAGDQAEMDALKQVFEAEGAALEGCALGSVKSMIGHTKCTAGVASLVKVALALRHKVLPPTLVKKPNPKARFHESPFYINSEVRPWIRSSQHPRRAGVSAFGFGGTNFHAVLEEYDAVPRCPESPRTRWDSELLVWTAESRAQLILGIENLVHSLVHGAVPELRDLSYSLWQAAKLSNSGTLGTNAVHLALVIDSHDELRERLALLLGKLRNGESPGSAESGVYFAEPTGADSNEVAFLFPGQGSQYPGMLAELAIQFAEIREQFELVDYVLKSEIPNGLSRYILPPPWFTQEQQAQRERALKQTHIAQPALGAADIGMFRLLQCFGIQPSFVAGHSYGEYVALCAAGVFDPDVLFKVSEARGRAILEVAGAESGTMAAVNTDKETVRKLLENLEDVWIANVNSRKQTVISGTSQSVRTAMERMKAQDLTALAMPVSCAFHSPLMAPARERLVSLLRQIQFSPPKLKVFSNTAATLYPSDPQRFADLLADHLVQTVNFADEIEAMYLAGARIFVEVGPRNVLTSLTREILGNRPNVCVATDVAGRSGLIQLQNALGQLYVLGIVPRLDKLFEGRALRKHNLAALVDETLKPVPGPSIWLVNGGCARPAGEAGQHKTSTDSQRVTVAAADAMTGSSIPSGPLPAAAIRDHSQHDSSPNLSPLELSSRVPDAACIPQTSSELSAGVTPDGVDAVMLHFSQLMEKFLETQRDIMLSYIHSCPGRFQMSDIAPITADENQDALVVGAREEPSLPGVSGRGNSLDIAVSRSTAVGSSVVSSNPSRPVLSQERLTAELLKVVNQRTGYPPEMLDLDLDIEANLGIDSIKRVEILADFQRSYLSQISNVGSATIDSLTSIKTLRGIVDHAWEAFHLTPSAAETDRSRQYRHATADGEKSGVPRFMLRAVDKTVGIQELVKPPNLVVIVADDGAHVARSVAEQLRSRRVRSIVVRNAVGLAPSVNEYTVDLGNETSVAEITSRIRHMEGPIGGIIHLSALQSAEGSDGMTVSEWRHRLACEAKSLFFFAKATLLDLKEIGSRGTSWLASAVPFNSTFNRTNPSAIPSAGAIRGFIKTVMLEYPEVCCKVIALDTDLAAERLGMQLLDELWSGDREVEVGFHRTRRLVLRPEATALPQIAGLKIDSDWVILVTGGGRGITAEVACHLAKQRPTLLLVGRTPFPVAEEDRETASLSPGELKRWMIARSANASISATPAEIDYDCQKLLNDREMREKVMAMKRAGARVHYIEADVRDEQAITKVVEEAYRIYGRLDGVIHGAGVIEDRLFENKTPDSFDRVFHTKVDGAFILSRAVHGESLKFFAFFSSISGIFGNPGQADYAAANAGLDQLAEYLNRKWPSRVFSLAWGPWEKIGMVSDSVRQQFLLRGVQIITPTAGVKAFEQELQFGRRGEVQVILGAGPWEKPKLVPKRLPDVLVGASSEAPTLMMKD